MSLIYFLRPEINQRRIFIGFDYKYKIVRVGHILLFKKNKFVLKRYLYKVNEKINIIKNPDLNLIDKKDLDYLKFYNYI
jgi:hypothetical protein